LIEEIARVLKLQIPELVYANLDEAFGRTEADEEIQDLTRESRFKFSFALPVWCHQF
jgi:hypothetical protein